MKTGREPSEQRSITSSLTLAPSFPFFNPIHSHYNVHYFKANLPHFLSQFPPLHIDPQSFPFLRESLQPCLQSSFKSYISPHSVSPETLSQTFFYPSQMSQTKLSSSLENYHIAPEKSASSYLASEEELNVKKEAFHIKSEAFDIKGNYSLNIY